MYNFAALFWDTSSREATRESDEMLARFFESQPSFEITFKKPGCTVLAQKVTATDAIKSYRLANQHGVIFGRLFCANQDLNQPPIEATVDEAVTKTIISSKGRALMELFWGSYVAILINDDTQGYKVVRDCSGKLPCYWTTIGKAELVLSDIALLSEFTAKPFAPNWRYIASFLVNPDLEIRDSALEGVTELLAGDCLHIDATSRQCDAMWNPVRICKLEPIEDPHVAEKKLLSATQLCVDGWAQAYKRIMVSLSGGFDSSVVANCLARAPRKPESICLNRYNEEPGEDEREFARLAAKRANMQLLEVHWSSHLRALDERVLRIPPLAKPSVPIVMNSLDTDLLNQLAADRDIEAIWTGQGGDHLFFAIKSPLGASDYFRSHGLGPGFGAALSDAATISRLSRWTILKQVYHYGHRNNRWVDPDTRDLNQTFLSPLAYTHDLANYSTHPWAIDAEGLPLGKQLQICILAELVNRHRPQPGLQFDDEHHPLISQPLIETSLRIPSYVLLKGGRHRGLAVRSFSHYLPEAILARDDKGATTSHVLAIIRRNQSFVRELLNDGMLRREGLIDQKTLDLHLKSGLPFRLPQIFPLLACIAAEAWAQRWTSKLSAAA